MNTPAEGRKVGERVVAKRNELGIDASGMTKRSGHPAGGAATGSGMNYQALVTSIAGVNLLVGAPLAWLDGIADDVPVAIWSETIGPGDDIRIELSENQIIEVQVKKGLRRGSDLWSSLVSLATGVEAGKIDYGVLVVSPDSSRTIKYDLSQDIIRLGQGRKDALSKIGQELYAKLSSAGLEANRVCQKLRIQVIQGLEADAASIREAKNKLSELCATRKDSEDAWARLYQEAHRSIARRGRWEASTIMRMLVSNGIAIASRKLPGDTVLRLSQWVLDANRSFFILGVKAALSIEDAWLPLRAMLIDPGEERGEDLASAMAKYHASAQQDRSYGGTGRSIDAEWIGRFYTRAVIVAGPGMGKSTLMTKLANHYARDGYPVLKARLSAVAARMTAGHNFQESALHFALDGSGLSVEEVARGGFQDWVLLCDGLDECGTKQELVAEGIKRFAAGYPRSRVIITTRRIGYDTGHLSEWRHYEILTQDASAGATNLAKLLGAATRNTGGNSEQAEAISKAQLERSAARDVVSRSPQMLGMAASLLARGGELGSSKVQLYQNLFGVIDTAANPRSEGGQLSGPELTRLVNILGWELMSDPLGAVDAISRRCADRLRLDLGLTQLQAQKVVSQGLQHWQDVGLIEQVRYGPTTMLSFIHKTFAEFAAARFICEATTTEERRDLLSGCFEDRAWNEVFAFACGKLGDEIILELLDRRARDDRTALDTALRLIADANAVVSDQIRSTVIELAFQEVDSAKSMMVYKLGLKLAGVAARFPREVALGAVARMASPQVWTRLVAWTCVAEAGHDYSLDQAQIEWRGFLVDVGAMKGSLLGGLTIGSGPGSNLVERFASSIVTRALTEWPADKIGELMKFISDSAFGSVRFHEWLASVVKDTGCDPKVLRQLEATTALAKAMPSKDYWIAHDAAVRALLEGLAPEGGASVDDVTDIVPLQLSALLDLAGFGEAPASDVWVWTEPYDKEVVREVLHDLAAVAMLDLDCLQQEAAKELERMDRNAGGDALWFRMNTVDVDVPGPDWSRVNALGLDKSKLGAAVLHESQWLSATAASLLGNLGQLAERDVDALLSRAQGFALATTAYLAFQLGADVGAKLVLNRLKGPITHGFEHLLRRLKSAGTPWSDCMAECVTRVLLEGQEQAAEEAAALALQHARLGEAVSVEMLESAYRFWLTHEKPYPDAGLVVESPRRKLLEAMECVSSMSDERVVDLLSDARSDVREFAMGLFKSRAASSPSTKDVFISRLISKDVLPASVSRILASELHFSASEVTKMFHLLEDDDPKYRLALMGILKRGLLSESEVMSAANRLLVDPEREIRERARLLLESL